MEIPPSMQERIEKQFDHFCKTVLKNEARDIWRHNQILWQKEKPFSELTTEEFNQLLSFDKYKETYEFEISYFYSKLKMNFFIRALSRLREKIVTSYLLAIGWI